MQCGTIHGGYVQPKSRLDATSTLGRLECAPLPTNKRSPRVTPVFELDKGINQRRDDQIIVTWTRLSPV